MPRLAFKPELHDGRANGGVDRWTPSDGWTTVEGLEGALPNGVAVSADGATYFLADTIGCLRCATAQGTDPTHIPLPLAPDNLKWSDDGRLLTTGVQHSTLDRVFATLGHVVRHGTLGDAGDDTDDAVIADPHEALDIAVVAVDPTTLDGETLLADHAPLGVPTTAVDGRLYLTSLFGLHLARLRPRS